MANDKPVLILGAGINGVAVARDLLLNGIAVHLVEKNDVAYGATSRSSRLIHGGVRYLEYGEFRLVSESLTERAHLLKLAPQFVHPLTLYIPVRTRFGGLFFSIFRFLSAYRIPLMGRLAARLSKHSERGVWLVRAGLTMYDWFARKSGAPKHRGVRLPDVAAPAIDADAYRWACQYMDAWIQYPERLVVAMLHDCRRLAAEQSIDFQVHVHATAELKQGEARVVDASGETLAEVAADVVINATGAWGDKTLSHLSVKSGRVFGGTKGSHLISHKPELRSAIGSSGIYAEADDGRLIFILPFNDSVMVGTTDVRFEEDPGDAIASNAEIDYLLEMVNDVLPTVNLTREDVGMHYSGVRPLPFKRRDSTAVISRDHSIKEHSDHGMTVLTLVGGKLTTCRAFAHLVSDRVFDLLQSSRQKSTDSLPYAGADGCPSDASDVENVLVALAKESGFSVEQVRSVWDLCGSVASEVLMSESDTDGVGDGVARSVDSLPGTNIPEVFVRWVIEHEWVVSLEDLVERRLMLVFHPGLNRACLEALSAMIPGSGPDDVAELLVRLRKYYGITIAE